MAINNGIISLEQLTKVDINFLFDVTSEMKRIVMSNHKKAPQLMGKSVAIISQEQDITPSMFSLACEYLGASSTRYKIERKLSLSKLRQMCVEFASMGVDIIALCDVDKKSVEAISKSVKCSVINGGDTFGNSIIKPLAMLTLIKDRGDILENTNISFVGDVSSSPTAMALVDLLHNYNASISIATAFNLEKIDREKAQSFSNVSAVLKSCNAIIVLGVNEDDLIANGFSSSANYAHNYCFDEHCFALLKPNTIVLTLGSTTDGLEITKEVLLNNRNLTSQIATYSISLAMAVMYLSTRTIR